MKTDIKALFKDYRGGRLSASQVAAKHGISRQRMYQILESYGVEPRKPTKKRKEIPSKEEVASLYNQERNIKIVAKALNSTVDTCRHLLREAGIKPTRSNVTPEHIRDWKNRIKNGENIYRISLSENFSYHTIRLALQRK